MQSVTMYMLLFLTYMIDVCNDDVIGYVRNRTLVLSYSHLNNPPSVRGVLGSSRKVHE